VWLARPATAAQERELAAAMAAARSAEYEALAAQAAAARETAESARAATLRRLRGELRRITRRDYFPPAARERARAAVEALAGVGDQAGAVSAGRAGRRP
jgi:cobalamin biosynthesis protein CobD/CbiB